MLHKRSQCLAYLRAFFYEKNTIEVETPLLSPGTAPDAQIEPVSAQVHPPGQSSHARYLITSPELALKRLLAEGVTDLFYLGKVFRDQELGRWHQIEFTLLEWYHQAWSMNALMQETAQLIQQVLHRFGGQAWYDWPVETLSYQAAFARYAGIEDLLHADSQQLRACLQAHQVPEVVGVAPEARALWMQLVWTQVVEPQLGQGCIACVHHYPADQAALAQLDPDDPRWALRFEVYVAGQELANGYQELEQAQTYRARWQQQNQTRRAQGAEALPMDQAFMQTLAQQPLPSASGVALGVDRLLALALGQPSVSSVMAFDFDQA